MTTMRAANHAHSFQRPQAKTVVAGAIALMMAAPAWAAAPLFDVGNLIVSVEGNGVWGASSGSYVDNQAAPLTLFQFAANGTASASYVNALVLPQTASGNNSAVSGEYGSSSEGGLQLSGDGRYLTIMGYGVNAAAFNANPTRYGTLTTDPAKPAALGQSGSLQGQGYTPVARVAVLINANGQVDSSTALYGVYNGKIRAACIRPTAARSTCRARARPATTPAACSTRPKAATARPPSPAWTRTATPRRRTRARCRSTTASCTCRPTASRAAAATATSSARWARPAPRRRRWPTAPTARPS